MFFATNFIAKVPKYLENCLAFQKIINYKVKTIVASFLATFEEIGQLFVLQSGHTGRKGFFFRFPEYKFREKNCVSLVHFFSFEVERRRNVVDTNCERKR